MRSIVPKQDTRPYENVYRRQLNDDSDNPIPLENTVVEETANHSGGTNGETFRDEGSVEEEFEYEYAMSISELLYSTSSFYAIVVPGESLTMNQLSDPQII